MEEETVSGSYVFRGIEYVLTLAFGSESLVVEVEDKLTADQWRGTFDAAYLEDLTHKTGNFKQFKIFASMLESALTQSSDSVSLDLLTYSDLESLRNRKAGVGTKNIPGGRGATLNSKRYLILTYTVEFDRIHYPLPLPYMGKPDPRGLQESIRQLRQEIKTLKQTNNRDYKSKEIIKLQREYDQLLQEKEDTEAEFVEYKREVQHTSKGSAAKEVRILKGVIKNLEEELVEEKARNQRAASKRNQECRKLREEVDELRASERNLKVRVRSLTNELAIFKGRRTTNTSTSSRNSIRSTRSNDYRAASTASRDNSRENSRLSYTSNRSNSRDRLVRDRSNSRERLGIRSNSRERLGMGSNSQDRFRNTSRERLRDTSRERLRDRSNSADRLSERGRSKPYMRDSSGERSTARSRARSNSRERLPPSPGASRIGGVPKFDPTAFIKEQARKRKEAELKKKRHTRARMNGSTDKKPSPLSERNYSRNRSSSFGSVRSRASSVESLTDYGGGMASDTSVGSQQRRSLKGSKVPPRMSHQSAWSSPDVSFSKPKPSKEKILASTPEGGHQKTRKVIHGKENIAQPEVAENDYYDRSEEISEIDARLNRLQQFMKTTIP